MRLRLRLALAFLLLSALPLAALALYSYNSSSKALRRAAQAEAEIMARELEMRVESVASNVDQRVKALARLPAGYWAGDAEVAGASERRVLAELAGALPFIEGFQFVPAPAPPAPAGAAAKPPAAPTPNAAPPAAPTAPVPPVPGVAAVAPAGTGAMVDAAIQLGLKFAGNELSPEQRAQISKELDRVRAEVARALAESQKSRDLSAEQRKELIVEQKRTLETIAREQRHLARLAPEAAAAAEPAHAAAPAPGAAPFPKDVSCSVTDGDQVVGELKAKIKAKDLLKTVLAQTDRAQGEIPFALNEGNTLYVASSEDGEKLDALPAIAALKQGAPAPQAAAADDWVLVTRKDPSTGFRFGIAKPLSEPMADLKRATARNFAYGLALVALALVGMVPISSGLIKNVRRLEEGATRIAAGDLSARVPVASKDEFGHLAATFNRMAEQLTEHQQRLLEQERRSKQQEIERALLAAENERRGRELEEARRFQLSLLPRELPTLPGFELAVSMTTATEVGGDYYDFLSERPGELVLAVGDATGHGPAAGTMVTAVKSLFMAGGGAAAPATFLAHATGVVHRMGLYRMAMALAVARLAGRTVTLSSAGMPPVLHFRAAEGRVDEIELAGTPLGARAEFPYAERSVELRAGDALLFLSDGFPETPDRHGEPLGYERVRELFGRAAAGSAEAAVAALRAAALEWTAGAPPCDDVTFLVLKASA